MSFSQFIHCNMYEKKRIYALILNIVSSSNYSLFKCHKGFGIFKFLEKSDKYKWKLKVMNPVQYCIQAQGTVK